MESACYRIRALSSCTCTYVRKAGKSQQAKKSRVCEEKIGTKVARCLAIPQPQRYGCVAVCSEPSQCCSRLVCTRACLVHVFRSKKKDARVGKKVSRARHQKNAPNQCGRTSRATFCLRARFSCIFSRSGIRLFGQKTASHRCSCMHYAEYRLLSGCQTAQEMKITSNDNQRLRHKGPGPRDL